FGLFTRWRGTLYENRWLHRACVAAIPMGFIATVSGWITAEVGRQPYTVHGLLRTADSVSPVPAASVATSLTIFVLVYGLLFATYLYFVHSVVRKGPDYDAPLPERTPKAMQGARPATVLPAE
ncbi:MAG: cytochrome ubiquinol oxidase subunit I, partial [Minwuiales bacterium]|nr:cytochrome ubiquinol oxidase subunit I [Minwuiales bacterium]